MAMHYDVTHLDSPSGPTWTITLSRGNLVVADLGPSDVSRLRAERWAAILNAVDAATWDPSIPFLGTPNT